MSEVTLPMTCFVDGMTWCLFTFDYKTPDGVFSSYFYAISPEHAAAIICEIKETAELKGQMLEAYK